MRTLYHESLRSSSKYSRPLRHSADKKKDRNLTGCGPENLLLQSGLFTLLVEHLHRLGGLSGYITGSGLSRSAAVLGHGVQNRSGLGLAAAGAETYGAGNGKNQSCYFHKN